MKKIAIVDPASYTLPYDYFYIIELSKYYEINFYYSTTKYNYEFIEKLEDMKNVNLKEYEISTSITSGMHGFLNYIKMLITISLKRKKYIKIHFMWNLFLPLELPFFLLFKNKFIFTFHNDVPHNYKSKTYKPYKIISKIARNIVFVSNYTKDNFFKNYGYLTKCYVLEHGVMQLFGINNSLKANSTIKNEIIFFGRVEEYKGVDLFIDKLKDYNIKIYGKWNPKLEKTKQKLKLLKNVQIIDYYLSVEELGKLLTSEVIFILPYKEATQSGVLYTLLAYEKVFISSDVGENSKFLKDNGLSKLVFKRDDEYSIEKSIEYAKSNYWDIKLKLKDIRNKYEWKNIMTYKKLKKIYE